MVVSCTNNPTTVQTDNESLIGSVCVLTYWWLTTTRLISHIRRFIGNTVVLITVGLYPIYDRLFQRILYSSVMAKTRICETEVQCPIRSKKLSRIVPTVQFKFPISHYSWIFYGKLTISGESVGESFLDILLHAMEIIILSLGLLDRNEYFPANFPGRRTRNEDSAWTV